MLVSATRLESDWTQKLFFNGNINEYSEKQITSLIFSTPVVAGKTVLISTPLVR